MEWNNIEECANTIEMLANGINPITGETISNSDVLNDIQMVRLLFSISSFLKQEAHNCRNESEQNFFYYDEKRISNIVFVSEISLTKFLGKIVDLYDEDVSLKRGRIQEFLIEEGILEKNSNEEAYPKFVPTKKGNENGFILKEDWKRVNHFYLILKQEAQKYILDLLKRKYN